MLLLGLRKDVIFEVNAQKHSTLNAMKTKQTRPFSTCGAGNYGRISSRLTIDHLHPQPTIVPYSSSAHYFQYNSLFPSLLFAY